VGGLDGRDDALANARPGGRPPLAAPAFQVPGVMNEGGVPVYVGPYTGSSVSAAVTSAIAAAVWHQNGSLRPDQVMDTIRTNGVVGSTPAEFCFGGSPCPPIRRISLGRAVEAAAGTAVPGPRHGWGMGVNPAWSPGHVTLADSLAVAPPQLPFDGHALIHPATPAGCSAPVFGLPGVHVPVAPELYSPCPAESLPNEVVAPAVCPQPGNDPCPACRFAPGSTESIVELGIDEALTEPVYAQVLVLSDRSGAAVARFDMGRASTSGGTLIADGLLPGHVYKVLMPGTAGLGFSAATIQWATKSGGTSTSQLIVGY
jgi:hypothetical protein